VTSVEVLTERQVRIFFDRDQEIMERIVETSVHRGWQLREISLDRSSVDEIFAQLSLKSKHR